MRQTFVILIALLVILPWSYRSLRPSNGCPEAVPAACTECLGQDPPAEHVDPADVEDRVLLNHLNGEATRLIDAKRTTSLSHLVKQLDREQCELTLPEPRPLAEGAVEVYAKARASVVVVAGIFKCKNCSKWHSTTASGFVLTSTGAVVTNYHVVNDREKETLLVMTADQHVFPVEQVLAADRRNDVAILKVDAKDLLPLSVTETADAAPVGSTVSVISHPANRFFCYTTGVVSRRLKRHSADKETSDILITADFARGSSGAPVLNGRGQVVGIVRATDSVYYSKEGDRQKNLQMVFKICVPSASLLHLVRDAASQ